MERPTVSVAPDKSKSEMEAKQEGPAATWLITYSAGESISADAFDAYSQHAYSCFCICDPNSALIPYYKSMAVALIYRFFTSWSGKVEKPSQYYKRSLYC